MGQPQNGGRGCPVCHRRGMACTCGDETETTVGELLEKYGLWRVLFGVAGALRRYRDDGGGRRTPSRFPIVAANELEHVAQQAKQADLAIDDRW